MNKTTEALELAEALENDAKEHREVSYGLDCPPERTANWKHALNCEAAARLIREALAEQSKCACDSPAWCTKYKKCNREMLGLPKAEPVKQKPVAAKFDDLYKEKTSDNVDEWQYIEGWNDALDIAEQHFNTWLQAEPVATVGTFFIEQILGTHLHEGQKLYAAQVSAKAIRAETEQDELTRLVVGMTKILGITK